MAYNVSNWGFISAGQTITGLGFYINGGANMGAQFAQALPENPGGLITITNEGSGYGEDGSFWYQFDLTNQGLDTEYSLNGGGLS
jgi:hypothetical protein